MTSSRTARAGGRSASAADPMAGHELAAGRLELGDERRRDGARPAADHRPADRVGVRREHQPERGTQRAIEAEHRVGRDPGEQRAGGLARRTGRGRDPAPTAAPAARSGRAPADGAGRGRPAGGSPRPSLPASRTSGPNRPPPGPPIRPAEPGRGRRHRPLEDDRPPAVERVRDRGVGVDQLDAVGGEVDRPEERRGEGQAAGSSSTRRGGSRGVSAPRSGSRHRPSRRPRRRGPSARHGPA